MNVKMVDSNKQKLKLEEIVKISAQNTKSPYTFNQIYVSIMKELTLPGSIIIQKGNTIFIVHRSKENERAALIRALNADTAQHYLKNSEAISKELYEKYGIDIIAAQYSDPSISNIFKYVGRKKPKDMGYTIKQNDDKTMFEAMAQLGPLRN